MSKDKFEIPVMRLVDADTAADTAVDMALMDQLEQSHHDWVRTAMLEKKAPDDMIIVILMRSAADGAVANDLTREAFLDLAKKTFEYMSKVRNRG
jgi:hypothetical protein